MSQKEKNQKSKLKQLLPTALFVISVSYWIGFLLYILSINLFAVVLLGVFLMVIGGIAVSDETKRSHYGYYYTRKGVSGEIVVPIIVIFFVILTPWIVPETSFIPNYIFFLANIATAFAIWRIGKSKEK